MSTGRILLVDDDHVFRESTAELLRQDGHEVVTAEDGATAGEVLSRGSFDLVVLDLRMPGPDGIAVTEVLRCRGERMPILIISGVGTVDAAVRALQHGADDFLMKPVEPAVLSERVAALLARRPRPPAGPASQPALARIVGRAPAMRDVLDAIRVVAPTQATVLVTGETGTGKELVARAIHEGSQRQDGPFVTASVGALAPGVIESELFGHVRGAFTGAVHDRSGMFRAAQSGTIFLDEIGDLSPAGQRRLLRVLQEREVTPVGSVQPIRVDVRVIAATNRDLRAGISDGHFREDLFYRLNVFAIHLPPLRERREDIPLIAEALLQELAAVADMRVPTLSPPAVRLLRSHAWPGNVRELRGALESATIRAAGRSRIDVHDLPADVRGREAPLVRYRPSGPDEREAIMRALDAAAGVRARAAALLGMGRTTLWRKMREYGIDHGMSTPRQT